MQDTTQKATLTLVVDHDDSSYENWEIFSLQCDTGPIMRYGPPSEPRNIEKGLHSLSCLICHQAYLRRMNQAYARLPSARHENLKTLWGAAKAKAPPKWLEDLLPGTDSIESFFESSGGGKNFDIWFKNTIELRVESARNSLEIPLSKLLSLRNTLTSEKEELAPKLTIEIINGKNVISNEHLRGGITYGDEIQFRLKSNFSGNAYAFWVNTPFSVTELYPILDIDLEPEVIPVSEKITSNEFELTIPGNSTLHVDTQKGVETLLIIICSDELTLLEKEMVKNRLLRTKNSRSRSSATLQDPEYKKLALPKEPQKQIDSSFYGQGLTASKKLSFWEEHLVAELSGMGEQLHLIHLQNI